jgi:hypothetical protein
MSIHVSDAVWRHSRAKGSNLLVLLAIADNADTETGEAFPSIKFLAQKTRLSERGVQYALARLIGSRELERVKRGARGRSSLYRINTQSLRERPDQLDATRNEIDANGDGIDAIATAYQPSVEPSVEPSFQKALSADEESGEQPRGQQSAEEIRSILVRDLAKNEPVDATDSMGVLVAGTWTDDPLFERKMRKRYEGRLPEAAFRATLEKVEERRSKGEGLRNEAGYVNDELQRALDEGRYAIRAA